MKIMIEPMALECIKNKSKDLIITLNVVERPGGECSCCGGKAPCLPSVKIRRPKNMENYEQTIVEGITVYYQPKLARLFSKVTIKIEKILFIKYLAAAGDAKRQF